MFRTFIDKVRQLFSGKEAKTVAANFGYLTLLQVAGYVFPFITMPYLARVIGTTGFGKIAFASAIICWVQTVADWGFTYTATRDVAQSRDDSVKVSKIFSNVLWARLLLTVLAFAVLAVCILLIPAFRKDCDIILITFLMVPGHVLFPDWFFQAIEKMKYTTYFNLSIKFCFTFLVFVLIRRESDYILQPLLTSIGYIVCGIVSMILILKKWEYRLYPPRWGLIKGTIKGSADVFLNNLMPNLYNSFSTMLLGSIAGATANGIYDGGSKFVSTASQFQNILSRAFFPFLSRRIDKAGLFAKINMLSGVAIAVILYAAAPWIIKIFLAPEFSESVIVLRIFSVSMIFLVMSNTYGTNYLILIHKERILRNITAICSIIGMLISYPLIRDFSYIGAAMTVFISRMLLGVTTFLSAKRAMKNGKYKNMNINNLRGGVISIELLITKKREHVISLLAKVRTECTLCGSRESFSRQPVFRLVAANA